MGHLVGHRYSRAFALPVVMITSVVMMMVLLSGLTAASSVNVGLRTQYEDRMMQSAAAAGVTMAKDCIDRNDNSITWSNAKPLKPNTNCQGVEQFSCPDTSTNNACYLVNTGTFKSTFSVGVSTSGTGDSSTPSKGIVIQAKSSTGAVVKKVSLDKRSSVRSGVSLNSLSGVVRGWNHNCGVDVSGKAYCWGYNAGGQLGNGNKVNQSSPTAVSQGAIPSGIGINAIAGGGDATCAIATNSNMYCWGTGSSGQLGNGGTAESLVPTLSSKGAIPANVTLRSLAGGNSTFCGIGSDGKVYCWGSNNNGLLGNGSASANSTTPVAVSTSGAMPANAVITKLAMGIATACAVDTANNAYCWGYGSYGMLGNGGTAHSNVPVAVSQGARPTGVGFSDVTMGTWAGCGLGTDNKAYCWGRNHYGQLGNGNTTDATAPVAVVQGSIPTTAVIQSISMGSIHACVSTSNRAVYCWGYNASGQLGRGNTTNSSSPVSVTVGTNVLSNVVAGTDYSCAVRSDAITMCWGYGAYGGLGNSSTSNQVVPVAMTVSPVSEMALGVKSLDVGGSNTCATTTEDKMYCWGSNSFGQFGNGNTAGSTYPIAAFTSVTGWVGDLAISSLSVGSLTTCLVTSGTAATCMGHNGYGQLGDGTTTSNNMPITILQGDRPAGVGFMEIKTKNSTTCGIGTNGKAYCWGLNDYGQLGRGNTTNSSVPAAVAQGDIPASVGLKSVSSMLGAATCALGTNYKVYCWGYNGTGRLGNGTTISSSVPKAVTHPSGVTATQVDGNCMLGSDSWVYCWGYNYYGQVGNGTTIDRTTPVAISQGSIPSGVKIQSITNGGNYMCALGTNSNAYCWGYNGSGQLGNGTTTSSNVPVQVSQGALPSGVTLKKIAAGQDTTCAIASDQRVYCWGYNGASQLGNGTTTSSNVPVQVRQKISFRGSASKIGASVDGDSLLFYF